MALGLGSEFSRNFGYYADAVSPMLPTLPDGWENRLIEINFDSGVTAWFLEPNDTAISKYVRSEPRDREWIRAGLTNRILSLPTIEYRLRDTIMESEERVLTNRAVEEDRKWLVAAR